MPIPSETASDPGKQWSQPSGPLRSVANALVMGQRCKCSTPAQAATWLSLLKMFPITVDSETARHAWVETLALARAQDLSAFDAAYLELAMRRGLPLATLDKLKATAAAVGIALYAC
jgi:predicted nucleic acid-binding protein